MSAGTTGDLAGPLGTGIPGSFCPPYSGHVAKGHASWGGVPCAAGPGLSVCFLTLACRRRLVQPVLGRRRGPPGWGSGGEAPLGAEGVGSRLQLLPDWGPSLGARGGPYALWPHPADPVPWVLEVRTAVPRPRALHGGSICRAAAGKASSGCPGPWRREPVGLEVGREGRQCRGHAQLVAGPLPAPGCCAGPLLPGEGPCQVSGSQPLALGWRSGCRSARGTATAGPASKLHGVCPRARVLEGQRSGAEGQAGLFLTPGTLRGSHQAGVLRPSHGGGPALEPVVSERPG